jgi:hypothetical protein
MLELTTPTGGTNNVSASVDRSAGGPGGQGNALKTSSIKTTPHNLAAIISKIKNNN